MNRAPSPNSQISGNAPVNQVLAKLTTTAPSAAPTSVPRPPTATQITASIELAGANSDGLMMPTCGTYKRARDAGHARRKRKGDELEPFDPVADEAGADFGVAHRDQHLAVGRVHHEPRAMHVAYRKRQHRRDEQGRRGSLAPGC